MYFNVNFNAFFKLIKVHLLVSELYIYQNARCDDKNCLDTSLRHRLQITVFAEIERRD